MRFFFSIICCLFMCFTSTGFAQEYVGTIKKLNGDVRVQRNGQLEEVAVGTHVCAGDVIRTGKDGAVGLSFVEGTRVSLGRASEITVNDIAFKPRQKKYAFDVFLKKGTAVYTSGKLGKLAPEKVKFRTPKAIVGVRGTKFMVKI